MKIYILRCSDGSYYTGLTDDLKHRVETHRQGRGSEYTRSKRPIQLIYFEERQNTVEAKKREIEIKGLSRANKERLIKYGTGVRVSLGSGKK